MCPVHVQAALKAASEGSFTDSCLSQAGALVSAANKAACETLNGNPNATSGHTWGLYTCVCDLGWGGVDCTVPLIQVPRCQGIDAHTICSASCGLTRVWVGS
jgi:hypothetical protein